MLEFGELQAKSWYRTAGDGHTGTDHRELKRLEDGVFQYVLGSSTISGAKGWTVHLHARADLPAATAGALERLGFATFPDCPEFGFEECYWIRMKLAEIDRGGRGLPTGEHNGQIIQQWFERYPTDLVLGLDKLAETDTLLRKLGMAILR